MVVLYYTISINLYYTVNTLSKRFNDFNDLGLVYYTVSINLKVFDLIE